MSVVIAEAAQSAQKITRLELQAGDMVFDVWGGTYTLVKVTHYKYVTRAKRSDGQWFSLEYGSTITVIKGESR